MNAHFEDHCEVARDGVQAGRQVNDYLAGLVHMEFQPR